MYGKRKITHERTHPAGTSKSGRLREQNLNLGRDGGPLPPQESSEHRRTARRSAAAGANPLSPANNCLPLPLVWPLLHNG